MEVTYKIHILEDDYRYIEIDSITNEQTQYILLAQENNLSNILEIFKRNNIYLQMHNDGFEKDFLDFIGYCKKDYDEVINYLKEAKLINLHLFINDEKIKLLIDDNNKNNILVSFLYD